MREGTVYFDTARGRWVGQAPPERNYRTGKARRRKVVGAPGESKTSVARRLRALIDEQQIAGAPETVGEVVARWRATLVAGEGQSSQNLARIDSQIRNHVTGPIGSVPVSALTPDDVEAWLAERTNGAGELLARSTLKKLRSVLAQAYDYGVRRRYVTWNPARVAELPKEATTKRTGRALSLDDARKLIEAARADRLGAWVVVGLTMGLRPGEVSGLPWEAVDLERGVLVVYQALGPNGRIKPTKSGRTRTLAIPALAVDALREHQVNQERERALCGDWPAEWAGLVFLTAYGTPLDRSNTRRMTHRIAARAGLGPLNPYDLRHTAAELVAATTSEHRLADLLGHRDTSTTRKHYRHPETSVIYVAAEAWQDSGSKSGSKLAETPPAGLPPAQDARDG